MTKHGRRFAWARGLVLVALLVALLTLGATAWAEDLQGLLKAGDEAWVKRDEAGQLGKAVELYEKALKQEPEDYTALWRLARAYEWLGKHAKQNKLALLEKGKSYSEHALKVNDQGWEGHYWQAALIGRIGEAKGILNSLFMVKPMKAELDRVVALNPNDAGAHYVLSLLYWKVPGRPLSIGDKQKALEEAKLAVKLEPANTQYRLGLGEAYLARKDKAAARQAFEVVLALPPTPDDPVQSGFDRQDAEAYLAKLK